jgi:hypothetical protein
MGLSDPAIDHIQTKVHDKPMIFRKKVYFRIENVFRLLQAGSGLSGSINPKWDTARA